MNITMERLPQPAATTPTLNALQLRFLALHQTPVYRHQWHFCGTQLRAHGDAGTATIWADDLEALVVWGLMRRDHGVSVCLTDAGRAVLERECV